MITSKVTLSEGMAHQKSSKGQILEWMQNNPSRCRNTNATVLARSMQSEGISKFDSLRQLIQKMVNNQMINRYGNKRRANFFINYMHKDIPPYILENAPSEEKEAREKLEKGLKKNQYVDEVGCVVTKPEKKEEPKPEVEEDEEFPELDEIIEHIATVPVAIRQRKESGSTSISITLNINLNN